MPAKAADRNEPGGEDHGARAEVGESHPGRKMKPHCRAESGPEEEY